MNYKGDYSGDTNYAVGDVAVYTDGIPYVMHTDAPAGVPCHNVLYWERVPAPLSDAVVMFHSMLATIAGDISELTTAVGTIPTNISDEAITLTAGDDDYLITVDASGEEPELAVTKVEEEAST